MRCWSAFTWVFVMGVLLPLVAAGVQADDSAYCRRVGAQADSEAALLLWPRLSVQGLRYPSGFDNGPMTNEGFQLRVGMSYSLLDAYRATRLTAASELDCQAHSALEELQNAYDSSSDTPQRSAYQAQAQFLDRHRGDVDAVVERARKRLSERIITVMEFNELLTLTDQLERKAVQAQGAASRLAPTAQASSARPAGKVLRDVLRLSSEHEAELSSLRELDAWGLRLNGGLIPLADHSVDWFGWVEVNYSLGGLFRGGAERRYRQARRDELRTAVDQLPARLSQLQTQLALSAEQAQNELRVLDKRLGYLRSTAAELEGADAALVAHTRDALTIEALSAESERVYLQTLLDSIATERSKQRG